MRADERPDRVYGDRDETGTYGLQRGEWVAAIGGVTVGLFVGLWMGLWSVPASALSVPTAVRRGHQIALYQPVPRFYPLLTGGVLVGGCYAAWRTARTHQDRDAREVTDAHEQ